MELKKDHLPNPVRGLDISAIISHYEERLERLEREPVLRDAEITDFRPFYELVGVKDTFSFSLTTFCTAVAGEEKWGPESTGEIVPMAQACQETWV